jgi:hypothetical protein
LHKTVDLVADIKRGRLEWLGHLIRVDERRVDKNIFEIKQEGKRQVERATLRRCRE